MAYSGNPFYHLQRLEICLAMTSTPTEAVSVIQSSENGQPAIKGLPKRHSLRQDDATFIVLTIYWYHTTRHVIFTQVMRG
jgi:hypothetical protein